MKEVRDDYDEILESLRREVSLYIRQDKVDLVSCLLEGQEISQRVLNKLLEAPRKTWRDYICSLVPRLTLIRAQRWILKPLLLQRDVNTVKFILGSHSEFILPKSKASKTTLWKNINKWGKGLGEEKLRELFPGL